jgi:hypothetical protein
MSVHKLPSGSWRVMWRDDSGKQRSQTFPRGQKAEADAFDGQMRARKLAGTSGLVIAGRQTLADYWAGPFADHLGQPDRSERTRRDYGLTWRKHIEPRVGNVPLTRLGRVERVRRFHADLAADGVKPSAADKA